MKPTVIICPGNGCSNILQSNWYGQLHQQLSERNIVSICENFPDPHRARRSIWIPHIRRLAEQERTNNNNNNNPDNIILVGHSSGAQAALRYAEEYQLRGIILVAATYTDLGDAGERASGYYPQQQQVKRYENGNSNTFIQEEEDNPYLFDKTIKNCPTWYQFHSDNDPFIPLHEAERIRDGLQLAAATRSNNNQEAKTTTSTCHYRMLPGHSHFFEYFPELLETIESMVVNQK